MCFMVRSILWRSQYSMAERSQMITVMVFTQQRALNFQGADFAEAKRWYDKKSVRDREARRAYRRSKGTADGTADLYMLDIMREGITSGDSRLR